MNINKLNRIAIVSSVLFLSVSSIYSVRCFAEETQTQTNAQPTEQPSTPTTTTTTTKSDDSAAPAPAETTDQTQVTADEQSNAPAQTASEEQPEIKDPFEKFNRAMFWFNDKLDTYILKPVATFYNTIMPRPLNEGVHNFFLNVGNLPNIANDILQFNFYQMANDMWRFGVNTTIGIGGLFDVGSRIGLNPYVNDFGLTLAMWGYKNSNYLVLPFFGPYTVRDGIGIPVDYYVFSIYPHIHPQRTRYVVYGLGVIDRRAQLLQFQEVLEEASIDKYVFTRNAYLQRRAYQIEDNQHRGYADQLAAKETEESAVPDNTVIETGSGENIGVESASPENTSTETKATATENATTENATTETKATENAIQKMQILKRK